MDWKKCAEQDLRNYSSLKKALINLNERFESLQAKKDGLKAVVCDSIPIKGGAAKFEDKMISNIVEADRLKNNMNAVQHLLGIIERGLESLDEEERQVLNAFFIEPIENCVPRLCEMLHCGKSQIYRIREQALYAFTVCCYGIVDF